MGDENMLSTSFAAPEVFGDRLDEFRAELRDRLRDAAGASGKFLENPGDTEVLIARRR